MYIYICIFKYLYIYICEHILVVTYIYIWAHLHIERVQYKGTRDKIEHCDANVDHCRSIYTHMYGYNIYI